MIRTILLSLGVGVFIVGVHQTFIHGFHESYFFFMICAVLLLVNRLLSAGEKLRKASRDKKMEKKPQTRAQKSGKK
jgi:uncharacterized membrane protein